MKSIYTLLILFSFTIQSIAGSSDSSFYRVLFLGNSYTYVNHLPTVLEKLATSGGDSIFTAASTPGGCSLGHPDNGHLFNSSSLNLIAEGNWDFVVLQEQSQFPVIPHFRDNYTYPAAKTLDSLIHVANPCAQTLFFMTWGRKIGGQQCIEGYCSPEFNNYFEMQNALATAYLQMTTSNHSCCVPVGKAWSAALQDQPQIELFSGDGSHPALSGTYLAACTFYATIFKRSPLGLPYTATLENATFFQQTAEKTVLTNPAQWYFELHAPKAEFTWEQDDWSVEFYNQSTDYLHLNWDFGDTATDTIQNPIHHYYAAGEYPVSLTAICGHHKHTKTNTIHLLPQSLEGETKDQPIYHIEYHPSNNSICVQWKALKSPLQKIHIYQLDGTRLKTISHPHQEQNIALPSKTSIVIVQLISTKGRYCEKLFIRTPQ